MRQKLEFKRTGDTVPNGDTYREDLPDSGYLTSLYLNFYGAGVTDSMNALETWRIMDFISSIEVKTSEDNVLKSYTGRMLRALMTDDGYPPVVDQEFNYGSSTKRWHCWIDFGRFCGDPIYGLDLSPFDNVQLQITSTAADAQFASDISLDWGCVFQRDVGGGNPFRAYLKTEEYRKITTVASKKDYIKLPTAGKLRRMLVQVDPTVDSAENAQRSLYQTLNNFKMTLGSGREEHLNCNLRHLWFLMYMQGRSTALVGGEPYHTSLEGIRTGLGQTLLKAGMAMPQGMASATPTIALEPGDDSSTQKILKTGTDNASMLWLGHAAENCTTVIFNHPEDTEENYLDLDTEKTVELELETGSNANDADATYRIVLDRLVTQ